MNKICTSIEQSKKLIELGIDRNTADMLWTYDFTVNDINGLNVISTYLKPEENDIPAWSLSALMELIPDIIEDYVLRMDKIDGEYYIWYDKIGEGWSDNIVHPSSKNFIDAAFETIVWLKENEKI